MVKYVVWSVAKIIIKLMSTTLKIKYLQ